MQNCQTLASHLANTDTYFKYRKNISSPWIIWLINVHSPSRDFLVRDFCPSYGEVIQPCAKFASSQRTPLQSLIRTFPHFIGFTRLVYCLLFNRLFSQNLLAVLLQWSEQKSDPNVGASFYLLHCFATKGLSFGPYILRALTKERISSALQH